jgi:hypothetical protein
MKTWKLACYEIDHEHHLENMNPQKIRIHPNSLGNNEDKMSKMYFFQHLPVATMAYEAMTSTPEYVGNY